MEELTKRERQIAEMIAWGASTKDVARRLFLSVRTVENHVRNIHEKIGLQKANELSAWWFCNEYGIDPALSPLKKTIAAFLVVLIFTAEFTNSSPMVRSLRTRTRIETRSGRRSRKDGESDTTTFEI